LVLKRTGDSPRRVTVPMHGRDLKKGMLRSILREADLTVEEFVALL
jgi:predicted RNA binding protein YcfA (HicA-like mRNA interferase family)